MNYRILCGLAATAVFLIMAGTASADGTFEGRKKCFNCHKGEGEAWEKTLHGKAMESLKPSRGKKKDEAMVKAKLDPKKDYTKDKDCVGCHVDGFGKEGGYIIEEPEKFLTGVGCESCHGAGSDYRKIHRKAGEAYEKSQKTAERASLVEAGQDFEFQEKCNACHLNYEGSPWKGAKKPYTPFTPTVDKKYSFDFEKYVRDDKAMHTHFKLAGTFTGPPMPKFHEEFQKNAKPAVKSDKGGDE
ncbi:MAG: cytochrome c family protein [Nitrospira sp.]|nr:cytochrome c family protein [Nitrospira sp.]